MKKRLIACLMCICLVFATFDTISYATGGDITETEETEETESEETETETEETESEETEKTAIEESESGIPLCSCDNEENTNLNAHSNECERQKYARNLCAFTALEIYGMWDSLAENHDVREEILTYLSWTDQVKLAELNGYLENGVEDPKDPEEPEEPENPEEPEEPENPEQPAIPDAPELPDMNEVMGECTCSLDEQYGSVLHDKECSWYFANLPVEVQYMIYISLSDGEKEDAIRTLHTDQWMELEEYLEEHPVTCTVADDGTSVLVAGAPEGYQVTAESMDHEFTESIMPRMVLGNEANFVLDISLTDAEGNEWQPENGGKVMVKVSLSETTPGQKTDFIHIMDHADRIEEGLADGSVKTLDLSALFVGEDENGEEIEITPDLSEEYWKAIWAAEELGYEKTIAYEIITGVTTDEGYSTFYTDSFSAFSNSSLGSGTYYINWDLTGYEGNGKWTGKQKGLYTQQDTDSQLHQYYYDSIGSVTIPTGNTVSIVFVKKGSVPITGTITVNGVLNILLHNGGEIHFYTYKNNIWGNPQWVDKYCTSKCLNQNELYYDVNNTIYRASGNTGALFKVGTNGTLNITGLNEVTPVIIDGKSISAANGAIVSSGTVNLNHVSIINNVSSSNGGGIYLGGSGTNTVSNVNINNCNAGAGAGIYIDGSGTNNLTDVNINSCIGNQYGGGIDLHGTAANNFTRVNINECKGLEGSAIRILSTGGSVNATSCNITNCIADYAEGYGGGTIRTWGTTVTNSTFTSCVISRNKTAGNGGAFYWNAGGDSKLTINSCTIDNNEAAGSGGGIFCESLMEIKGTTKIYGNQAIVGGGVCVNSYGGSTTPTNKGSKMELANTISIYENTATGTGGGIAMTIRKRVSLYDDAVFQIILNGANISNNTAESGGGIHIFRETAADTYTCSVDLNYGTFQNNTATTGNGGGVYTENVDVTIGNTSGNALIISGNTANNGIGGAVYSTGDSVLGKCTITNGTLTSNSAANGGAIGVNNCAVTVSGGTINSNSATETGGAIYSTGSNSSCTISNGTMTSNTAKYGAAIGAVNGTVTANGGTIKSNDASYYGGAIYASGSSSNVTVSGTSTMISENEAANGGAIYATAGGEVNVNGGIISKNRAVGSTTAKTAYNDAASAGVGGGIYVGNGADSSNKSTVTIVKPVGIYDNTAAFAAADAFASGVNTSMSLPEVKNMNLTGYSGSATGWYEDYAKGDTGYSYGFAGGTEGVRYVNARNTVEVASASGITKYAAITLGTTKSGYGNLTIVKTGSDITDEQMFVFTVENTDTDTSIKLQVSIVGEGSITIYGLKDGTYKVTEDTDWSWKYTPDSKSFITEISGTNVNPKVTFHNTLTNEDYMTSQHSAVNVYGN